MTVPTDWFKKYQAATAAFQPFRNAKEASKACNAANSGSEQYTFALSRWIGLSLCEAEKARTIPEASAAYESAPRKSEAERLARDKWDEYSIVEARNATTIEEAKSAHDNARRDSKAAEVARERWQRFLLEKAEGLETIAECKALYEEVASHFFYSQTRKLVFAKWDELALALVKRARSWSRACDVFELCPLDSESQKAAIEKIKVLYTGDRHKGENALYLKNRTVESFREGHEYMTVMSPNTLKQKKDGD